MADQNYATTHGIRKFYERATKVGFARDFQFRVLNFGNGTWLDNDEILYLSSATMPGRTINAISVPYIGLNFQVPGTANYNSNNGWQVKFRCDETFNLRDRLERWSRAVFDDATSTGTTIPNAGKENSIDLIAIDNIGNARKHIKLIGAWLQSLGDLNYNLAGNGSLLEMTATIAFQYWITVPLAGTVVPPAQPAEVARRLTADKGGINGSAVG